MSNSEQLLKRIFWAPIAALTLLTAPVSTLADDTDIYLQVEEEGEEEYLPNVLFIFDTSGSMGSNITIREDYDPSVDYGGSDPSKIYVYTSDLRFHITTLNDEQNSCQAMKTQIAQRERDGNGDPTWFGQAARWRPHWFFTDSWQNICSSCVAADTLIDCRADQGSHGIDDTSAAVWTSNGDTGPYSTSSANRFSWRGIRQYYYVTANYHDYLQNTESTSRRKIDIMKDEAKDLVENFDGLNVGLMRFDGSDGGYVIHHFSDLSDPAQKTLMQSRIDALPASGNTPLAETLWEAGLYYQGKAPFYGTNGNRDSLAINGTNYNSPIVNSCQRNHIVLLTDGNPFSDNGRDGAISNLGTSCSHSDGTSLASQTCLDELSQNLFEQDQFEDFEGKQSISTYTIGFDIDIDLLNQTATKGNGEYYTAGNSTELKAAFTKILLDITDKTTTFSAPAVTVSAYSNLNHRNELYYAIFQPGLTDRWNGNIKRYRLDENGDIRDFVDALAVDDEGENATGFFRNNARSWWSSAADGPTVTEGGFAEQLTSVSTAYVYTGEDSPTNVLLTQPEHSLSSSNSLITNEMLGLPDTITAEEIANILDWATGADVDDENPSEDVHQFVGDPLHSQPTVVTYGGTRESPDDVLFGMTNLGMLHAIDTDTGNEIFRFMPQSLLPNLVTYRENEANQGKIYGLDGPMTVWRQESADDDDVTIESGEGDRVILYFGMRRGGTSYYAMDVTNRNAPRLLWQIDGGEGQFTNLGQTWSDMKLADVNWNCDTDGNNCTRKKVLFFGGGYDGIHDLTDQVTTGDIGSAIYMVDAETGELLWSAQRSGNLALRIENSIPSDVTVGDIDGDGAVDVLFAVDIMGHVWRVDFNKAARNASDFATGAMVNDLSGTSGSTLRRFYNSPDVVAFSARGSTSYFAVNVGSGYRADPKEEIIADKFYVLFHDNIFGPPTDGNGNIQYTNISMDQLLNATNVAADREGTDEDENNDAPFGYFINLTGTGEKVLSNAVTFGGTVYFTTYLTQGEAERCDVDVGSGRRYGIRILSGEGVFNGQRSINMNRPGIPPSPVLLFTEGSEGPIICVGTECELESERLGTDRTQPELLKKTYWLEQNY